ncbi:hypothetical protein LSS_21680 [Leptospira santarosai serovar Shermani str. LT 821]|uniref:Uncharacterized protein n=1 Tax=Leptospira santarosai serovar Shermani str. LT 821 TaxID=758847 RepID=A0A097ESJ5_9LEPT|nr:hypothetical protein LSS_21680 [Leptospira santarosai serovar Shermani str. LT 821]
MVKYQNEDFYKVIYLDTMANNSNKKFSKGE